MTDNSSGTDTQPLTVLVVDDDRDALEELEDTIDLEGWSSIIAGSVDMALEVLEWYPYISVIVTDVHFVDPSGDTSNGFQLISRARTRFPDRGFHFIVLSGDPSALDAEKHPDVAEFLPKPLDGDRLVAAVRACTGGGQAESNSGGSQKLLERIKSKAREMHDANGQAPGDAG